MVNSKLFGKRKTSSLNVLRQKKTTNSEETKALISCISTHNECIFCVYSVDSILITYSIRKNITIYNAITLNKREIDRVHKNELYIATVSIKQKAVDCIKTALWFWFNATRISARMTSKTMTFVT